MTERTELEIECMSKEENYICGYNDGVADTHEQYMLIPIAQGMTNGDVIKAMFPNELLTSNELLASLTNALWWGDNMSFDIDWWNALYKRE